MSLPTLQTERLILRPFTVADAPRVRELAGTPEVALTTLNVPHPYAEGMAMEWIGTHAPAWAARELLTLAVTSGDDGLVGALSLRIVSAHRRGELGYWIGLPFWNRGYATEAAQRMVDFGFDALDLNRIQARHMTRNPASGRVMEKLGMRSEGIQRQYLFVRGRLEDIAMRAILKSDRDRDTSAIHEASSADSRPFPSA